MKTNSTLIGSSDLTLEELEGLAEEICLILTKNKGLTIPEYIERVSTIPSKELGYRKIKAICNEPKLEAYFPDEVFKVLRDRFLNNNACGLNDDDKIFLNNNKERGIKWLSKYMYMSPKSISKVGQLYNIKIASKLFNYTPDILAFIKRHADEGPTWIAKNLNLSINAISKKSKRVGIKLGDLLKRVAYAPEEDLFIRDNAIKGSVWLSKNLNRSLDSVRDRAKHMGINLPIVIKGKQVHRFTVEEDNFIRKNYLQGALWISKQLNLSTRSIQHRSYILKVRIARIQKSYTPEENQFIKDNVDKGIMYLSDKLNVSMDTIKIKLKRMGLCIK